MADLNKPLHKQNSAEDFPTADTEETEQKREPEAHSRSSGSRPYGVIAVVTAALCSLRTEGWLAARSRNGPVREALVHGQPLSLLSEPHASSVWRRSALPAPEAACFTSFEKLPRTIPTGKVKPQGGTWVLELLLHIQHHQRNTRRGIAARSSFTWEIHCHNSLDSQSI